MFGTGSCTAVGNQSTRALRGGWMHHCIIWGMVATNKTDGFDH